MLKHTTLRNPHHQTQLSLGPAANRHTPPSPLPISFPSPPPSIASFASSTSTHSSFSSTSSSSSSSTNAKLLLLPPPPPSNEELATRCHDTTPTNCQQQQPTPPIPPVRHKRRQRLLLEQKLSSTTTTTIITNTTNDEHLIKSSPVPAPRTSFNQSAIAPTSLQQQQPASETRQPWRSGSPPLASKSSIVFTNQYWTYQRQKLHNKQFAPRCHLAERPKKPPKVTIKVYAQTLCQDVEYITLPIDNQTKSSQVVRMLLKKFRLKHRDPNLFYLTLERWIKKDGLPVKSVMLLGNDACPAQLQSCCSNPPHNDIKFTMLMRNGALVKIYCSDVVPDSLYKCLSLSTQTTVEETIELLLNCLNLHLNLGSDTSSQSRDSDTASLTSKSSRSSTSDQYDLIEVCDAANYKRVLRRDEYLVEVHQSLANHFSKLTCNDDTYSSIDEEEFSSPSSPNLKVKGELIIKLVRREEQQIEKSFDHLIKLNGNLTMPDAAVAATDTGVSDATFKVSSNNYHLDHNGNFARPKGIYQKSHHQHDESRPYHHANQQQNNCLAHHHHYRHYSQEQLVDDLDKLSLFMDDDKEQNDDGNLGGKSELHRQVNSAITQVWNDNKDNEILSHKIESSSSSSSSSSSLSSSTSSSSAAAVSSNESIHCSVSSDDDGTRACQSPIDKKSLRGNLDGIELYENISLMNEPSTSDDSSLVTHNFIADNDKHNYTDDFLNSTKISTAKDLIAINQGNQNMPELFSTLRKNHDGPDKQVLIVYYQPKIYCLSVNESRQRQFDGRSAYVRPYENLDDKIVAPASTSASRQPPPFIMPRYNLHDDN